MGLIALAAVVGLFAAVALGLSLGSNAHAQALGATLSISSATITPGGATTCPYNPPAVGDPDPVEATCVVVTLTPDVGTSVGSVTFEIAYDTALLDVTDPIPDPVGDPTAVSPLKGTGGCNVATSPITCAVANTTALGGNIVAFEFTSIAGEGTSPLTLTSGTDQCSDLAGTNTFTCATTNGTITIAQATPTPTPVPATPTPTPAPATPTPTPTATPAQLPQTGGTSSDGSGTSFIWALGALGLAVLAGGVWAVSRTRRHTT